MSCMDNQVLATIKERRSIRRYTKQEVPEEVLETIINAGKYAPSAEGRQPWKFVVVTDTELIRGMSRRVKEQMATVLKHRRKWKKRFAELKDDRTVLFLRAVANSAQDVIFHDAPAVVFILTTDELFNDESCACAAQNMMLAAWSLGIGSCWIGFATFLETDPAVMQKLKVPEGHHIAAAIVFGYPGHVPSPPLRQPTATIINWIKE